MIRPDLKLICENMLMSEGFQGARMLAIKFVTLYELSSELLSKQAHYDWCVVPIIYRTLECYYP
jgi:dynein heavy chain, axonemal